MIDLRMTQGDGRLTIETDAGALVGRYVLDDPFKPYLHPLMTPAGRVASAAIMHDHKHHKGLMYALRPRDVNFWEERVTVEGEVVGRQRPVGLEILSDSERRVAFRQTLRWEATEGDLASFDEERTISASVDGDRYVWSWACRLTALRPLELRKSQWSIAAADGRLINYHGLGLRLPRSFGGMPTSASIAVEGEPSTFAEAIGARPNSVTLTGSFDGEWPTPRAGVTMRQDQKGTLFALRDPFAYLSLGPTNAEEMVLSKGDVLAESYQVEVFDVPPSSDLAPSH